MFTFWQVIYAKTTIALFGVLVTIGLMTAPTPIDPGIAPKITQESPLTTADLIVQPLHKPSVIDEVAASTGASEDSSTLEENPNGAFMEVHGEPGTPVIEAPQELVKEDMPPSADSYNSAGYLK